MALPKLKQGFDSLIPLQFLWVSSSNVEQLVEAERVGGSSPLWPTNLRHRKGTRIVGYAKPEMEEPLTAVDMGSELVWSFQRSPEERNNSVRFRDFPPFSQTQRY